MYRIAGNFRGVSYLVIFVVKIPVTKFQTHEYLTTRIRMRGFTCAQILQSRKLLLTAVSSISRMFAPTEITRNTVRGRFAILSMLTVRVVDLEYS